jgi:hypothetical protein
LAITFFIGAISAASAQSAYTTGTAESTAAVDGGYGGGIYYDYAPNYEYGYSMPRYYGYLSE